MSSTNGGIHRGRGRGGGRGSGITRTTGPSIDAQRETAHIPQPNMPISSTGPSVPDTEATMKPAPFDRRIYICPIVDGDIGPVEHNQAAVKKIEEIISRKYTGTASTYTKLKDDVKEMWFGEFKRCFRWNVDDESEIKRIFKTQIARAFSQKMYTVRKTAKNPNYMNADAHNVLNDWWSSDEFQENSRKAKQIERQILVEV